MNNHEKVKKTYCTACTALASVWLSDCHEKYKIKNLKKEVGITMKSKEISN